MIDKEFSYYSFHVKNLEFGIDHLILIELQDFEPTRIVYFLNRLNTVEKIGQFKINLN